MRRLLTFLAASTSLAALAQPYGNEWIDFTNPNPYLKVMVVNEGLHRVEYDSLAAALTNTGKTIADVDPQQIQVFHMGVEQAVYVFNPSNPTSFNAGEFIEFYARGNDGSFDTDLYEDPSHQANPYYSLVDDSAAYFITWNPNAATPLRITDLANDLTNLPPKETWYMHYEVFEWHNLYWDGDRQFFNPYYLFDSRYDNAEGYGSSLVKPGDPPLTYQLNLAGLSTTAPVTQADFTVRTVSAYDVQHYQKIDINGSEVVNVGPFSTEETRQYAFSMDVNDLVSGSNDIELSSLGSSSLDRNGLTAVEVAYPRSWDFGSNARQWFSLTGTPGTDKYIEISNFFHQGQPVIIYDVTNNRRMVVSDDAGLIKAKIPMLSSDSLSLFITGQGSGLIQTTAPPRHVPFTNYAEAVNQGDYFIVTHPAMTAEHLGTDWVEAYRKLRDNTFPNTGRFKARIAYIQELYDQFAYGIQFHPKGLRNFIRFGTQTFVDTLQHVFIVGKGRTNRVIRSNGSLQAESYVTTFGYGSGDASADNLFACQGHDLYPLCAIGRLSATSPDDVRKYYEKMVAQEAQQALPYSFANKDWMKRVLHLGGGSNQGQQATFASYLADYERVIEDTCFGGNVTTFLKTSPDPVQIPGYFNTLIDSGVALITFFGHSSPGLLEFSLNDPADYNNYGRMPVIIANGCLSGIICGANPGISEEYVLEEDRGAIAFIATSGLGVTNALDPVCQKIYETISQTHYGEDLGIQLMHAYREMNPQGSNTIAKLVGQQTLHGDPAYRFGMHNLPDYSITKPSVTFDPPVITTDLGFFDVDVAIHNIGKAVNGDFNVRVQRKLANGSVDIITETMTAPHYLDTITFTFPVDVITSVGLNEFTVVVDVDPDSIDEMIDAGEFMDNNTVVTTTFISSSAAFPIFPYNYSIVGNETLTLSASTIDPFAPTKTYTVQIDTSKLFATPLAQTQITQGGGVVSWSNPPITLLDSTVYYWRITADTNWHTSSFLYLQGTDAGWNQSHYFQFTENGFDILELEATRLFEFTEDFTDIFVYWGKYPEAIQDLQAMAFYINGAIHHKSGCVNGVILAVFDNKTGLPWLATDAQYSWINNTCNPHVSFNRQHAFNLATSGSPQRQHVKDVLNMIPDSMFILMLSYQDPYYNQWDTDSLFEALYDLGADSNVIGGIDTLPYLVPFAFFTQKGNPAKARTHVGASTSSVISETFSIDGVWDRGFMYSSEVGPAYDWNDLKFNWHTLDAGASDYLSVDIYGKDNTGEQTLLVSNVQNDTTLDWIDPDQYPYLHVHVYTEDTAFRTPAQLDFWRVLYQPSPDAAVNPQIAFHFKDSVLAQGDWVEFEIGIENVTEYDMDSLLVQYVVYNQNKNILDTILSIRYDSLRAGQQITTEHTFNTMPYAGYNILTVEANPDNDQPERHHFNNFAQRAFVVDLDLENPLLDVTFDGHHIMDGDIVSGKPEILVRLKDENRFLAMNDSSLFEIYIKHPGGDKQRMDPDGQTVIFIPADEGNLGKDNTAQVVMHPELLIDGEYQLIVSGEDKSGNESADLDYVITFRVINTPMISNVLNYPNPFTTSTRFVFTLTGTQIPDFMKIQIMTVTGKVVREVTGAELGNLHIGTNISEFAWDGTDEYGDALGNGVYLYRVVAYLNGEKVEHYSINAIDDTYFPTGIGKMYLVR